MRCTGEGELLLLPGVRILFPLRTGFGGGAPVCDGLWCTWEGEGEGELLARGEGLVDVDRGSLLVEEVEKDEALFPFCKNSGLGARGGLTLFSFV